MPFADLDSNRNSCFWGIATETVAILRTQTGTDAIIFRQSNLPPAFAGTDELDAIRPAPLHEQTGSPCGRLSDTMSGETGGQQAPISDELSKTARVATGNLKHFQGNILTAKSRNSSSHHICAGNMETKSYI